MFLGLYATLLFLLAVILVPTRLSVVVDSWEYFLSIRYWFYGGLLVLNGIDLVDSFMKGTEWGFRTNNLVYWAADRDRDHQPSQRSCCAVRFTEHPDSGRVTMRELAVALIQAAIILLQLQRQSGPLIHNSALKPKPGCWGKPLQRLKRTREGPRDVQ